MYHLSVGTRNERISLIDKWGFMLHAWRPQAGDHESVVRESPLADYEQLVRYRDVATTETYELKLRHRTEDHAFKATQDLRRTLRLAVEYWAHDWQTEPVYIQKRAKCETGYTFALVLDARMPEDDQYHVMPFLNADPLMDDLTLIVRRGPWLSEIPGDSVCLEAWGGEDWCWLSHLEFDSATDNVNCGSAAHLDDLPLADMTAEAWVRLDGVGLGGFGAGWIITKTSLGSGWYLRFVGLGIGLQGGVTHAVADAVSESGYDDFWGDGRWHHVLMMFTPASKKVYLYVDGHEVTYGLQQVGNGAYTGDGGADLIIGNDWNGDIGWTRVRSAVTSYVRSPGFVPPERCLIPELDGSDEGFWIYEGVGSTTENLITPGTSDGTIQDATWACECTKSRGISTTFSEDEHCYPSYLMFGAVYEAVRCGSEAEIDDMPTAGIYFTVEAWVRARGFGGGGNGRIAVKSTLGNGWAFHFGGSGLRGYVSGATYTISESGTDDFSADNKWHHVAMVYDPVVLRISLFIDGVEPSYNLQQVGVGPYVSDAGAQLVLGNTEDGTLYWDGDIGWLRISSNQRYFGTFTPPDRCTVPADDGNTYGIWIYDQDTDVAWNAHEYPFGVQTQGSILGADYSCEGCIEPAGGRTDCYPACLEFVGFSDRIIFGSPADLDDLPNNNNQFTAEAWVRFDGWGGLNEARIFDKETVAGPSGWRFNVDSTAGLGAIFRHTVQNPSVNSGTDDFSPDGLWHHVAVTFDNDLAGARLPRLWIDGVEPSYGLQQAAIGNYVSDAAENMYGGNAPVLNKTWDKRIGWMRLSDSIRYTANFTPQPMCELPDDDVNTVGLWVYEGAGTNLLSHGNSSKPAGALGGITSWRCECDYELGTSCQTPAYVANKRNVANITHCVFYDSVAGTFRSNLIGTELPYRFMPITISVGDIVYFGIASDYLNSGPFCSLVFDILERMVDVQTAVWEYPSVGPVWRTLTVHDNTWAVGDSVAFGATGINSIHWHQTQTFPWVTTTIGGATEEIGQVEGWWVRLRVTALWAATGTPPLQGNRDIFTVTWPHLDIPAEEVGGDIPAGMRFTYKDESDGSYTDLYAEKVIVGTRSNDRGENFVSFINLGKGSIQSTQNPDGVGASGFGGFVDTADVRAASGWALYYNGGAATLYAQVSFGSSIAPEYTGQYRALLRAEQATGTAGNVKLWVELYIGTMRYYVGEIKYFQSNNPWQLIDLGPINLMTQLEQESPSWSYIHIYAENTVAAVPGLSFFDLVLIPTDEWVGEFNASDISASVGHWNLAEYLDVDPLSHPRQTPTSAFVKVGSTDAVRATMQPITSQMPILQENKDQRVWFLTARRNQSSPYEWRSYPESAGTTWIYAVQRYLAGRGDR